MMPPDAPSLANFQITMEPPSGHSVLQQQSVI